MTDAERTALDRVAHGWTEHLNRMGDDCLSAHDVLHMLLISSVVGLDNTGDRSPTWAEIVALAQAALDLDHKEFEEQLSQVPSGPAATKPWWTPGDPAVPPGDAVKFETRPGESMKDALDRANQEINETKKSAPPWPHSEPVTTTPDMQQQWDKFAPGTFVPVHRRPHETMQQAIERTQREIEYAHAQQANGKYKQ